MIMRRAVSFIVALALMLVPCVPADAILFSGAATGGGGGTLLTTLTIQNTSGSTQGTDFVSQVQGHPFVKGQIANGCSGAAPIFKLHNTSTAVPFSEGTAPVCWPDGSLRWVPFMWIVPSSIAGSGSIVLDIYSGGTTPAASSRTLSDASSGGTDLNVSVTGLDNLSGVWVSNLNQGISAALADNYTYIDGDAGKVVRVRAPFRQSGADHGQMEGYWYLQLLNNNSGGFCGMRYMARVTQPWYNITSPAKNWRSFSAFTMNNGASLIRDVFAAGNYGVGKSFTFSSGIYLNAAATTNFLAGYSVRLTTTGSLPGLNTGQTYWVSPSGTNDFFVATDSNSGVLGVNWTTPSGSCSGTCTATAYPYLPQYGSIYTTGTNAKYDYIQAGGSCAADSTTRIAVNNTYWRSTKLIGPYKFETVSPANGTATNYYPGTLGPLEQRNLDAGGERAEIGPFTDWAVRHMYNQDAADEQNVRVAALMYGFWPTNLKNKTTFTIPVANNGHASNGVTYSGMPAVNTSFTLNSTGSTNPTDLNAGAIGFTGVNYSHWPEFTYYATLFTGEPQFNDMLTESGSVAMTAHYGLAEPGTSVVNGVTNSLGGISSNGGAQRNVIISGTTYYGTNADGPNGMRIIAWANRDAGFAAALAGGYEPAGAQTRIYLNDINTTIYASYLAYISLLPSYVQNSGQFFEAGLSGLISSWQTAYQNMTAALVAGMTEDAGALSYATYSSRFDKWIHDNFGTWMLPYFYGMGRTGDTNTPAGNSGFNPYLTSTAQFCGLNDNIRADWTNGNDVFTLSGTTGGFAPANDDQVLWGTLAFALQDAAPTNFSYYTPYYMTSAGVGGATKFKLSLTKGGAAVTPGNTLTSQRICIAAVGHPSTSNIAGGGAGTGIMSSATAAMNAAQAAGATVDATTLSDMNANLAAEGGAGTAGGLKYSFQSSY